MEPAGLAVLKLEVRSRTAPRLVRVLAMVGQMAAQQQKRAPRWLAVLAGLPVLGPLAAAAAVHRSLMGMRVEQAAALLPRLAGMPRRRLGTAAVAVAVVGVEAARAVGAVRAAMALRALQGTAA